MTTADPYVYARRRMVERLSRAGIRDDRVLEAMGSVPRHLFVREHLRDQAYRDFALPLLEGGSEEQTITQPYIVARMTELLDPSPEDSVLEVGTGSGYQAAILARLARWVFSLERHPALARRAVGRLRRLGVSNVKVQAFDGTVGWTEMAPFDRIVVTAGAPRVPTPLLEQLVDKGRLLVPEGSTDRQRLALYVRKPGGGLERREHDVVSFVPLVGRHGWNGADRGGDGDE